jgi:hypothetical protein
MVIGELAALLVTVMLPAAFPVTAGVRVTFMVADCPGVKICPEETPLALKPGPVRLTLAMLTSAVPELVTVTVCALLLPTFTLPKLKLDGLAVRVAVPGAATVRVTEMDSGELFTPAAVTKIWPL